MLNNLNLKFNPFEDLTPSLGQPANDITWAGMHDLKKRFDKIINDSATKRNRQLILNLGPWGGGKTFTAVYYYNKAKMINDVILTHIYVKSPKNDTKATEGLFKGIIEWLTFEKISQQISSLINEMGEAQFIEFINDKVRSMEMAKAVSLLGNSNAEVLELMNRYLYGGLTKTELKYLGLPKAIQDNADRIKFIAAIMFCFIGSDNNQFGRVILWLDEMEDLVYFSSKNYRTFSQDLRNLFDILTQDFTTFLNFTFSEPEEATVEIILGAAIWSRITSKIRFKELSIDDAYNYCIEQIQFAQLKKKNLLPFTEDSIRHLLGVIPKQSMTPREINKKFTSIINFVSESDYTTISKDIIDTYLSQVEDEEN